MSFNRPLSIVPALCVAALFVPAVCVAASANAQPVSEIREWTDTYPVTANSALQISNIWGDVKVSRGAEHNIVVTIKEHRTAPNQRLFERSLEVLNLTTEITDESVTIVVGQRRSEWNHNQSCRDCRVEYQFEVQVPADSEVDVGTVNDGKIEVSGVQGKISASNVNGPIHVSGALHCNRFSNINGVVDLDFANSPQDDCDIETINGDINLTMPFSAGLDLALDQANGTVISEFPVDAFSLPAKVEHIQQDGVNRYRIQQAAGLRLAGGGNTFTISSLNGDVRIQKSK